MHLSFLKHESSKCHQGVSAKSRDFGKNFGDIGETISKKHAVETSEIRDCMKLKNTLSSIWFLARQRLNIFFLACPKRIKESIKSAHRVTRN